MSDPKETLVLDICAEGPSLSRLGVIDMVMAHCKQSQRDIKTVYISRWSNPVEQTPFQRTGRSDISHFYWGSDRYWPAHPIPCDQGALWGFFMGRPTIPRLLLSQTLMTTDDALLSKMQGGSVPDARGVDLDREEFGDRPELATWYATCDISSLDGATIRDQYNAGKNTNRSLLDHYHRFCIEIVAESYIYGDTFFPTEKTVRPMAAGKPIIVMGPRHFLQRLRDQGFQTWGDLWDESYDELEGPKRLDAIQTVIADIQQTRATILHDVMQHAENNRHTLSRLVQKHRPGL